MLTLLGYFVTYNRKICRILEKKFPKIFGITRDYSRDQLDLVSNVINERGHIKILEAGGVDRPMLRKSLEYTYYGMDIDDRPECFDCYDRFLTQSIEKEIPYKFDLIISTTLLEHVPDNTKSIKAMYNSLNAEGLMVHYIPSKYHFYSICLRLVGPKIQKILIKYLRPEASAVTGYPAFFDNCSPGQMTKLCEAQGFKEIRLICYYKAADYFAFFIPAFVFVSVCEFIFERFGLVSFSSGFILSARK